MTHSCDLHLLLPARLPLGLTHPCLPPSPACRLQLFQECSVCNPESPLEALKQTLERLDAAIFAAPSLKHAVRARCNGRPCISPQEAG